MPQEGNRSETFDCLIDALEVVYECCQCSGNNPLEDHVTFEMPDGLPVTSWTLHKRDGKFVIVGSDEE